MSVDYLEIKDLTKQIGTKTIIKHISLQAKTGDLVVITGANGAGKTTLFQILAGLLPQTAGQILWNGQSYGLDHGKLAYVSHKPMLYEELTVLDNLEFFAKMYGTFEPKELERLLKLVDLWFRRFELVNVLSRGMQQRLILARCLLIKPSLILYDEPFTSLDSSGQELLRMILVENKLKTIQLLITHEPQLLKEISYNKLNLINGVLKEGSEGHS